MSNFKIYFKSILFPVLIGAFVGLIISKFIDYEVLEKPFLSPPSFVFPIVWTILYVLMGISYGLLKSNSLTDDSINLIYYFQLFVNALWPIFFFSLKLRFFSFIWIIFLALLIILMITEFYKKSKVSALLQIPYLLWTVFATYLTLFTYLLN